MLLTISRTGPRPPRCVVSPRPCTCRYGLTCATPPSERPVRFSHAHAPALAIVECMSVHGHCLENVDFIRARATLRQSLLEHQLCACVLLLDQTTSWMCFMTQAYRLLVQQLWLAAVFAMCTMPSGNTTDCIQSFTHHAPMHSERAKLGSG
jgi:hypothetical protein